MWPAVKAVVGAYDYILYHCCTDWKRQVVPRKMDLMTALQRVTVKLNIYHGDSDVPTHWVIKIKKYLLTYPSWRIVKWHLLNYVHLQRKLEINLQGAEVDGVGRTWLAGIEKLLFFSTCRFVLYVLLPLSHIFICKVCVWLLINKISTVSLSVKSTGTHL